MYNGGPLLSRRAWIWIIGTLLAVIGVVEILREFSPLTGRWEAHRMVVEGKEVELDKDDMRESIEIDGNYARVIWYSWCGNCPDYISAEGFMFRKGDRIELFKRIRNTSELETTSNGTINVLKNGHLSFETSGPDGKVVLEYRRESNATTLMDLLGWR